MSKRNLNFMEFVRERLDEAADAVERDADILGGLGRQPGQALAEIGIWRQMLNDYEAIHREKAEQPKFTFDRRGYELDAEMMALARPLHQYAALHRDHPDWWSMWDPEIAVPTREVMRYAIPVRFNVGTAAEPTAQVDEEPS